MVFQRRFVFFIAIQVMMLAGAFFVGFKSQISYWEIFGKIKREIVRKTHRDKIPAQIHKTEVNDLISNLTLKGYLKIYETWCEENLITPSSRKRLLVNHDHNSNKPNFETKNEMILCPCISNQLFGRLTPNIDPDPEMIHSIEMSVQNGGEWKPVSCVARQRLAVIVPFRNRSKHLNILLAHVHPILQRQMLHYRIFMAEQNSPLIFNKAAMMNLAYLEAKKLFRFDCIVFHDVDTLVEDDRNFYTCRDEPAHLAPAIDKHNYRLLYPTIFGAVTIMRPEVFESVNGFSNRYYGWGGEDDDMYRRLMYKGYTVYRPPLNVGRYKTIDHTTDTGNPGNPWKRRDPSDYKRDGLNSVQYNTTRIQNMAMYTWIVAGVSGAGYRPHRYRQRAGDCTLPNMHTRRRYQKGHPPHGSVIPFCQFYFDMNRKCQAFAYKKEEGDTFGTCFFKNSTCTKVVNNPDSTTFEKIHSGKSTKDELIDKILDEWILQQQLG